jgi:hypothetical protein
MTGVGKCRECGTGLRFVYLTTSKKSMPVDPTPDDDGNVFARVLGGRLTGHVQVKGEELPAGWQSYMPHFATCRNARRRVARGARRPITLFDEISTVER